MIREFEKGVFSNSNQSSVLQFFLHVRIKDRRGDDAGAIAVVDLDGELDILGAELAVGYVKEVIDQHRGPVIVNLAALVLFDWLLSLTRLRVSDILHDLTVGAAYLVAMIYSMTQWGVNLTGIVATSGTLLDGWLARSKWGERLDDERV